EVVGVCRVGEGFDAGRSVRPVAGVAGDGEFVGGQVERRGLARAVVVVGRGRMPGRQPLQPLPEPRVGRAGLARAYLVGGWRLVRQPVVGPWHDAISRTFGNRATLTRDVRLRGAPGAGGRPHSPL